LNWCRLREWRARTSREDLEGILDHLQIPTTRTFSFKGEGKGRRWRVTYEISYEFSVELSHEQTQVSPQEQESRVSSNECHFFARPPRNDDSKDCAKLSEELFVDSYFLCCCSRRRSAGGG